MKNRNFAEIQKLHVKPELHGDPETSKYNRNFTENPRLYMTPEVYEKHETSR